MQKLMLTPKIVTETIQHLQVGGQREVETVVLWLGNEENGLVTVREVYRPDQVAAADMFHIPPLSMRNLLQYLGDKDLMIAAQVHSHPQEAFHSRADDVWAIVRHTDALSLVLPYFSMKTTEKSFFKDVKSFRLTPTNKWAQLSDVDTEKCMVVQ